MEDYNRHFMKRVLCYFIMGSSYRENIYKKMNDDLNCDFIIGEGIDGIKEMNLKHLPNLKMIPQRLYFFKRKFWYDKGVISFFLNGKYDTLVIGGDSHSITVWLMLIVSFLFRKKVIMWTHGYYGRENLFTKIIKRIFLGLADRLFIYGEYAKRLLIENKIVPSVKPVVVYNSLNYDEQIKLRINSYKVDIFERYFSNNNPTVLFVGRLTHSKRLDMLIYAILELQKKNQYVNLIFIGEGEAREYLSQCIHETQLSNIWFYGECYDESILAQLIYNADICVSPGNVGLTAVHAMMFGTPVITHRDFAHQGPEFEAIIEGKTGSFFDYDDVDSLAKTMLAWFSTKRNREQIRSDCFKIIDSKYNPNIQIQIMKKVINSL